MAKAIVEATLHFDDPKVIAEVSKGLGDAMPGLEISKLTERLQDRGV
jgi:pyridoxal 5'-phosphate synthase pdxS subunit